MRQFNITVNGVQYSVAVEEVGAASAPVAAPVAALSLQNTGKNEVDLSR